MVRMALATRGRIACPDDKLQLDKTCNYIDTEPALDMSLDNVESLEGVSNGTSDSSIAEMNNNTNGNKLHEDKDAIDNMQFQTQKMTVTPSVMKKIKQIYMDEVPMHLSGLSLSGSGMELYVKIDETVDKVLRHNNEPTKKKQGILNKKRIKAKNKKKNLIHMPRNMPHKDIQQSFTDQAEYGNGNIKQMKGKKITNIQRGGNDKMTEKMVNARNLDAVASDSKQTAPEYLHHFNIASRDSHQTYNNPYGCDPNFQQFDNDCIDVMKPQDAVPSTSNMQRMHDIPIDFSTRPKNSFHRGFNSQNLPLKRRMSPRRWQNLYPIPEEERQYYDNAPTKKHINKAINCREGYSQPTTSQEKIPQSTLSEVSMAQSSVGPTFPVELIKPQTMDADTLIKFTEYTHEIRKDLKQKYKDLSKLVRSFEESVQERNSEAIKTEEEKQSKQNGQCRLM